MPEANDNTKGIKGTLPGLHKTKRNVPIKGRCYISEPKDVLKSRGNLVTVRGGWAPACSRRPWVGAPTIWDMTSQTINYHPMLRRVGGKPPR